MKFNKKLIMQPNTVVHCDEEWEARELLKWADSKGKKWCDGGRLLDAAEWDFYEYNTCYDIYHGQLSPIDYYCEDCDYNVLKFEEVIMKEKVKIKIDGKSYEVNVDKAMELGVLKEESTKLVNRGSNEELYYFISNFFSISETIDTYSYKDMCRYNGGNYFSTKEQAQYVLDHKWAINPISNWVAKRNIEDGFKIDWGNGEKKFLVMYDEKRSEWCKERTYYFNAYMPVTSMENMSELVDFLNKNYPDGL